MEEGLAVGKPADGVEPVGVEAVAGVGERVPKAEDGAVAAGDEHHVEGSEADGEEGKVRAKAKAETGGRGGHCHCHCHCHRKQGLGWRMRWPG